MMSWGSELEDSVAHRLALQQYLYPQEKIHVTADKSAYMTGDTIWLRAFVVNAATNEPVSVSKHVDVELRNPFDSVACRVRLLQRKGTFTGYVPLDERLPEDGYTLVAYTMFMQSQRQDYFFKKPVPVTSVFGTQSEITGIFTWENDESGLPAKLRVSVDYTDRATRAAKKYSRMDYVLDDQKMHYKSGRRGDCVKVWCRSQRAGERCRWGWQAHFHQVHQVVRILALGQFLVVRMPVVWLAILPAVFLQVSKARRSGFSMGACQIFVPHHGRLSPHGP